MEAAPEPSMEELLYTIAVTRLMFGPAMNIQAPPNLTPGGPAVMACLSKLQAIAADGQGCGVHEIGQTADFALACRC